MNKYLISTLVIASFALGFTANKIIEINSTNNKMKKVTGIGGIFFKCDNPDKMKEW